jgi:hypothetical protein
MGYNLASMMVALVALSMGGELMGYNLDGGIGRIEHGWRTNGLQSCFHDGGVGRIEHGRRTSQGIHL